MRALDVLPTNSNIRPLPKKLFKHKYINQFWSFVPNI